MKNTDSSILFLARELSGYFLASVQYALSENPLLRITIVYWPVNQQAPFKFDLVKDRLTLLPVGDVNDEDFAQLLKDVCPAVWIVSGWADKKYMQWVRQYPLFHKVIAFDTQWRSSLKFWLGAKWLYFKSIRYFKGAWVPGERQFKLARHFGFSEGQIKKGFYVADQMSFQSTSQAVLNKGVFKIIFVNRIVKEKGFPNALEALSQFIISNELNWKITVVGTGPLLDRCPQLDCIEYKGFVQPFELNYILSEHDVYVLASAYEPWGVSVHEAALSGLPLILSHQVGAADDFLESGKNGYAFHCHDYDTMIQSIHLISQFSEEQKRLFSKKSIELGKMVNQKNWSLQLCEWIKKDGLCAE